MRTCRNRQTHLPPCNARQRIRLVGGISEYPSHLKCDAKKHIGSNPIRATSPWMGHVYIISSWFEINFKSWCNTFIFSNEELYVAQGKSRGRKQYGANSSTGSTRHGLSGATISQAKICNHETYQTCSVCGKALSKLGAGYWNSGLRGWSM